MAAKPLGVRVAAGAVVAFLAMAPLAGLAERPVDLELVLAVDGSGSISDQTLELQLRGHAAAFRDRDVLDAIAARPGSAIAVTLVRWSDPGAVQTLVPWTVLSTRDDAAAFAAAIDAAPRTGVAGSTAVGNAILKAMALLLGNQFAGKRRIIDICSNGFSNVGPEPAAARDAAVAAGITINGLPILDEYQWLDRYYRENVIGGPGAFVRIAHGPEDFAAAIRDKLVEEVAGHAPSCGHAARPCRMADGGARPAAGPGRRIRPPAGHAPLNF